MRIFLGIVFLVLSVCINAFLPPKAEDMTASPLPKREFARLASGEFTSLSSDYFVLRAAIFYGSHVNLDSEQGKWLGNVLKLARYLDPYYAEPYWMAGAVLPWQGQPDTALDILLKGEKYKPEDWKIPFNIGFIYYYFMQDIQKAAEYFQKASSFPDSPDYLPMLTSRLYSKHGRGSIAIAFLRRLLRDTKDPIMQKKLSKRLKALQKINYLQGKIRDYRKQYDRYPETLDELTQKGFIQEIPQDPYGGDFYLSDEHRVWSTSELR